MPDATLYDAIRERERAEAERRRAEREAQEARHPRRPDTPTKRPA